METRAVIRRCVVALALGVGLASGACSGGDDGGNGGSGGGTGSGAVGSACASDAECTGYSNPSCLTELKPLETLVYEDAGPDGEAFRDFTLPYPGGYCTNTVENSCEADADCGSGGGCFRPFEGVDQPTIDELEKLGLPFSVSAFADVGICLMPCASTADCRSGYRCQVPLCAVMNLFNQSYNRTFCVAPETGGALVGSTETECPSPT